MNFQPTTMLGNILKKKISIANFNEAWKELSKYKVLKFYYFIICTRL